MIYTLPSLSYPYDALEPYIDAKTMEIHHTKHHQTYITNLNTVLAKYPVLVDKKLEDLVREVETLEMDELDRKFFRNNAGGHLNHSLFWTLMAPKKEVDETLKAEIIKTFGSIDEFKKQFSEKATKQFGSGWAWLVRNTENKLEVYSLPNQDSPLTLKHIPLIGLDVWEHAYYLKYQNRRPEYIESWWNTLKLL
jgi:Fe-Mn family superoxide dismutase